MLSDSAGRVQHLSQGHSCTALATLACAFRFAVLEAADAHNNKDTQMIRNSPKKAVFRLTEAMKPAVSANMSVAH